MNNYGKFLQLHQQQKPLVIANAWNVRSAQLIEQNGYEAIATSSGAIAGSLGYEDGEKMPFTDLLFMVKRIAESVQIPVSVDLERGYTNKLEELAENVQRLVDAGVVGINLEDAQGEDIYLQKLKAVKNTLQKNNLELFINARTDAFLQKLPSALEITLQRARLYEDAGADGLFVTAVSDRAIIRQIADATTLPLNVVGTPKLASIQALHESGVRRISMAVFLYKATYNEADKLLKAVKERQSFDPLF